MAYFRGEPNLEEILGDPIVRALMRRDAVAEDGLRDVIERARSRLGGDRDELHERDADQSSPTASHEQGWLGRLISGCGLGYQPAYSGTPSR